ncbi:hypothetical protein [Salinispora vitiensis]|uniref:hypothetical protein n=1 Tax=Salinispora vitiensis TaxID=999544 RepID=UPI0003A5F388|nr:hypothetical protein [Salinispora vitiensis]
MPIIRGTTTPTTEPTPTPPPHDIPTPDTCWRAAADALRTSYHADAAHAWMALAHAVADRAPDQPFTTSTLQTATPETLIDAARQHPTAFARAVHHLIADTKDQRDAVTTFHQRTEGEYRHHIAALEQHITNLNHAVQDLADRAAEVQATHDRDAYARLHRAVQDLAALATDHGRRHRPTPTAARRPGPETPKPRPHHQTSHTTMR